MNTNKSGRRGHIVAQVVDGRLVRVYEDEETGTIYSVKPAQVLGGTTPPKTIEQDLKIGHKRQAMVALEKAIFGIEDARYHTVRAEIGGEAIQTEIREIIGRLGKLQQAIRREEQG